MSAIERNDRRRNPRDKNRRRGNEENSERNDKEGATNNRKPQDRKPKQERGERTERNERPETERAERQDRRNKRDESKTAKLLEQGRQLAAEAQQQEVKTAEPKEEKAAVVKERRQRRKLTKQIRVKDQVAAEELDNLQSAPISNEFEAPASVNLPATDDFADSTQDENEQDDQKQRRNRRSPRHLRASGQRRRRGRDRRPNPFRLRKGGVASPEMAMGKVMPRYDLAPRPQSRNETAEVAQHVAHVTPSVVVESVKVEEAPRTLGGFAFPEMAMGKVILRREPAVAEAAPVVQEPAVIAELVTETVVEPVEQIVVETPVANIPAVEVSDSVNEAEATPAVQPVVEDKVVTEKPAEQIKVVKPAKTSNKKLTAKAVIEQPSASSPMTKAPGSQEISEVLVNAAPLRAERYQARGAGSQVARNQASAAMAKPQSF